MTDGILVREGGQGTRKQPLYRDNTKWWTHINKFEDSINSCGMSLKPLTNYKLPIQLENVVRIKNTNNSALTLYREYSKPNTN